MKKLQVGLYGSNGHQVHGQFAAVPEAELAAVCQAPQDGQAPAKESLCRYEEYKQFLSHPGLDLVSICSPVRLHQFEDIRAALLAGKHVYAEKPLVMAEDQLDELIRLAKSEGLLLREMASTPYESPYAEIGERVKLGEIGDIIQVFVQKSYPYADWRPQDEAIDGGLILQAGIHAVRLVELTAGQRVLAVSALQTSSGNPCVGGGLHMAASFQLILNGGGIGSAVINYLNAPGSGVWGDDQLRIFGTKGVLESVNGGKKVSLTLPDKCVPVRIDPSPRRTHFHWFVREILGEPTPLLPAEEEFQSLRVVLRAKQSAERQGEFL